MSSQLSEFVEKACAMRHINHNPSLQGMSKVIPDIVYATHEGVELHLDIICPWAVTSEEITEKPTFPAVMFVQGSAWTFPDINEEIPQLGQLSRRGYVVATVEHRNSLEGHPFPAFLEDVKSALRFLRKNAADYCIDPDRIGLWGTSSGGNSVLLTTLTADTGEYVTEDNADISEKINFVVDCFGPTDVDEYFRVLPEDMLAALQLLVNDYHTPQGKENARAMSPLYLVEPGKEYPPFLILHGNADTVVPYHQSERFYNRLRECGYEAEMICIDGAEHERDFWSQEVIDTIFTFIDENSE